MSDEERLRRAVRENNLFLIRRIVPRVSDIQNADAGPLHYTSLALAAVLVHAEAFEYLLDLGHDDPSLSRDADKNTVLCILATASGKSETLGVPLSILREKTTRMFRKYHERYPFLVDWTNAQGQTPLHIASINGNLGIANLLCAVGADLDLTDMEGNTPLHYASAWGHIDIVRLLIEKGCQYSMKNNQGFNPSDIAYSNTTMQSLQNFAQIQFEENKKTRRINNTEATEQRRRKNSSLGDSLSTHPSAVASGSSQIMHRERSASAATSASGSTDYGNAGTSYGSATTGTRLQPRPHQSSMSSNTSSQPSTSSLGSQIVQSPAPLPPQKDLSPSSATMPRPSVTSVPKLFAERAKRMISTSKSLQQISTSSTVGSTQIKTNTSVRRSPESSSSRLSPVATRTRQKDADAMAVFKSKNGLGSSPSLTNLSNASIPLSRDPSRQTTHQQHRPSGSSPDAWIDDPATRDQLHDRSTLRPSVSASMLRSASNSSASTSLTTHESGIPQSYSRHHMAHVSEELAATPRGMPEPSRFRSTTVDDPYSVSTQQFEPVSVRPSGATQPSRSASNANDAFSNGPGNSAGSLSSRERRRPPDISLDNPPHRV